MAVRTATGTWEGNLREGKGRVATESGVLDAEVTYGARFEDAAGTNPDELLGAALASCYSMALANKLDGEGHPPERVHTTAKVSFEKGAGGFSITKIRLECEARVPGIEKDVFERIAQETKTSDKGCPVSKALAATEITVTATLV